MCTEGDTAKIRVSTTDYEGCPLAAAVTLKFIERNWDRTQSRMRRAGLAMSTPFANAAASADVNTNQQGEAIYEYGDWPR
jgi:hypothetical protein